MGQAPVSASASCAGSVVLHVTGGIAAYKACEVLRLLQRAGCDVRVAMTADAMRFVGATTFEALSSHPVATSFYDYEDGPIPHIDLSGWADVQVVAPATANVLAKMATGIADDVVSATLLAAAGPVVVAPAMNSRMWGHAAVRANVATLAGRGVIVVGPDAGRLACGDTGAGKLAGVDTIAEAVLVCLGCMSRGVDSDLAGVHAVVTAGPTHEAIDPVRFIANASSGKMGYAIARTAAQRGADVTLVSGPTALEPPAGVRTVRVTSASEMHVAALEAFRGADVAICAAAVADYTPVVAAAHKLKKSADPIRRLELRETPDILASLAGRATSAQVVVGFAAETDDVLENARAKLARKGCDMIVANDVGREDSTFGSDTDAVTFVTSDGTDKLPVLPKEQVAHELWNRVAALLGQKTSRHG